MAPLLAVYYVPLLLSLNIYQTLINYRLRSQSGYSIGALLISIGFFILGLAVSPVVLVVVVMLLLWLFLS